MLSPLPHAAATGDFRFCWVRLLSPWPCLFVFSLLPHCGPSQQALQHHPARFLHSAKDQERAEVSRARAAWRKLVVRGMLLVRHEERSEEHTSELQSLMRISYAVFCLKKKKTSNIYNVYSNIRKQQKTSIS